jgi:hypothetical protein
MLEKLSLTKVITTVLIVLIFTSCTKDVPFTGLTKEFKITSNANGATYNIRVALPENFNASTDKYVTMYVLDGEIIFGVVANKCKELAEQIGAANVLVVSIGYGKDRSIDYTPTKMSSVTGGGPEFLTFIENELIPQIETNYRADRARSKRVILGHSYGGLLGAYSFTERNKIFGNYILLSPSLWFDNQVSFQHEKDNRINNKGRQQLVFLGIGDKEEEDRMKEPFERYYQILRDNYTNIKLVKNYESNTGHIDSRNPNIMKGLEYYFNNR